jgi:hypothetical protein
MIRRKCIKLFKINMSGIYKTARRYGALAQKKQEQTY